MEAVILAGGLGTRLCEETNTKPKPMIEIGGKPILWHIMKIYHSYGVNKFIICCGYKGYLIKEYFANYLNHNSDITFDFNSNEITYHQKKIEPWEITLIDTGEYTMTGGRIKRIKDYIKGDSFFLTYGDGLSNVSISDLYSAHKKSGKLATITAVQPPGRWGSLVINKADNIVQGFKEKPSGDGGWINGGFFVLQKEVINYIDSDETIWENEPLKILSNKNELNAFFHNGFWRAMDTLRDKNYLNSLWTENNVPWKVWENDI